MHKNCTNGAMCTIIYFIRSHLRNSSHLVEMYNLHTFRMRFSSTVHCSKSCTGQCQPWLPSPPQVSPWSTSEILANHFCETGDNFRSRRIMQWNPGEPYQLRLYVTSAFFACILTNPFSISFKISSITLSKEGRRYPISKIIRNYLCRHSRKSWRNRRKRV